jgi:uncharacterized protein
VSAVETSRVDPRPLVDGDTLLGARCGACGHAHAIRVSRCTRCRAAALEDARFGPEGTVWSTTTLRVASGSRRAPYTLAYVDVDEGPRVLAHVADGPQLGLRVAERVRLAGQTAAGDPLVEVVR